MSTKLAGFVITVEEAMWLIYSEINPVEFVTNVEEALELDFMEAELQRFRSAQATSPLMSDALLDEMEEEHIGRYEFEHRWEW